MTQLELVHQFVEIPEEEEEDKEDIFLFRQRSIHKIGSPPATRQSDPKGKKIVVSAKKSKKQSEKPPAGEGSEEKRTPLSSNVRNKEGKGVPREISFPLRK